jgi:hypothetical protein
LVDEQFIFGTQYATRIENGERKKGKMSRRHAPFFSKPALVGAHKRCLTTSDGRPKRNHLNVPGPVSGQPLSPLDVKGTLSILEPKFWHFSPCWGAAMSSSPAMGNLLRLGKNMNANTSTNITAATSIADSDSDTQSRTPGPSSLEQAARLATLLLFQGDRFHPVRPIRTKSMAAAYLTPNRSGTIFGLASAQNYPARVDSEAGACIPYQISDKVMQSELNQVGVSRSNYVDGQWTGVSLARWKELIQLSSSPSHLESHWIRALWLHFLWHTATTKQDLLDFVLALEEQYASANGDTRNNGASFIFNNSSEQAQALRHDPVARAEWVADSFEPKDLLQVGKDHFETIELDIGNFLHKMKSNTNPSSNGSRQNEEKRNEHAAITAAAALALEELCARWAIQNTTHKPQHRTSRYSYDGGDAKPDCVEVTVRELMELLLWDEWSLNPNRLPVNANQEFVQLYSKAKTVYSPSWDELKRHKNPTLSPATDVSGQEWFNLLSDNPTCLYLSKNPDGKPFELTPTLANVAEATRQLLTGGKAQYVQQGEESRWTSLGELADFWNTHRRTLPYPHCTHRLATSSRIHTFRQAMGEELVHHEIATVSIVIDADNDVENDVDATTIAAIELRLDKARGTSTVTHLHNQQHLVRDLSSLYQACHQSISHSRVHQNSDWVQNLLLILAMFGRGNMLGPDSEVHHRSFNAVDQILCARLGPDRRVLDPTLRTLDLTRRRQASLKAYRESCETLWTCVRWACQLHNHATRNKDQAAVMSWLIGEDPSVVDSQNMESVDIDAPSQNEHFFASGAFARANDRYWDHVEKILAQELGPGASVLHDTILRSSIRGSPMGELGLRRLEVQVGNVSFWESLGGLNTMEMINLMRKFL